MIDRVYFGWNPAGLIEYVFGPGRYNEHQRPRVVAASDGLPERWQPERTGGGEFDFDLEPLICAAQDPLKAARLPVTTPNVKIPEHRRHFQTAPDGTLRLRPGTVRHLTLRNADGDRTLTDDEWAFIAEEMMHRSGWSRRDDPAGPRWWAVRHDDDGIHIVAVMVRQDTWRRVWPHNDFPRLRRACQAMERRFGLTLTASADGTAAVAPGAAEQQKAARQGREPARLELRAAVAQAAARSYDLGGFVAALKRDDYLVEVLRFPSGDLRGYKIARRGDVDRYGNPVFYGGASLATDMSLPRLLQRWKQARRGRLMCSGQDGTHVPAEVWEQRLAAAVERARGLLHDNPDRADGVAHAVGELIAVLDRGQGMLVHGPGARWDRVVRAPGRPVPETGRLAEEMRWLARGLALSGASGAMAFLASLVALALQVAALLEDRGRVHQAWAARQTARMLSEPSTSRPGPPRPAQPIVQRGPGGRSTSPRRSSTVPGGVSARRPRPPHPGPRGGSRQAR